jgi:hypothetical protein
MMRPAKSSAVALTSVTRIGSESDGVPNRSPGPGGERGRGFAERTCRFERGCSRCLPACRRPSSHYPIHGYQFIELEEEDRFAVRPLPGRSNSRTCLGERLISYPSEKTSFGKSPPAGISLRLASLPMSSASSGSSDATVISHMNNLAHKTSWNCSSALPSTCR